MRKAHNGAMGLLAMLLSLTLAVGMIAACGSSRPVGGPVDLTTIPNCPGEAGPGPAGTPVPCVWGPDTPGNIEGPYRGFDWVLYVDGTTCPSTLQQSVRCIIEPDWSGGLSQ